MCVLHKEEERFKREFVLEKERSFATERFKSERFSARGTESESGVCVRERRSAKIAIFNDGFNRFVLC